ncbi:hypothetical protein LPTSP2_26000 [Leptospira ellinghausenii]|uniref:Uncharacterized protein n=1 Tax=Leptospira ellinghausenii TaxID=1917822 RepID=A0A2P2DF99_9LEPT|nr:hypothetical protein [Leptospira ellinghausenii]GBF43303.1 hypothetical protein LPTSP2_26000 [Leptospira ellinghausenii]
MEFFVQFHSVGQYFYQSSVSFCWRKGLQTAKEELIPLELGTATVGEITEIRKDYTQSLNGKSPTVVKFYSKPMV